MGLVIGQSDVFFQAAQLEWRIPSAPSRQNGCPEANPCLPSKAERFQKANVSAAIVKQARLSVIPECVPIFFCCACVYIIITMSMILGESCGPSIILVHFGVHLDLNSTCACVCEFGLASNGNSSRPSVWEGARVATKLHAATQAHIYCNPSIMTDLCPDC